MFTSRLREMFDQLTYSEQLIANAIMNDYTNFEVKTSNEIADRVGVGQATVVRFSKKLGYPTFKSMMLDIAADSSFYSRNEVCDNESTLSIMGKMKNVYEVSIDDALVNNSAEDIDRAVSAIEKADRVFCYGSRTSGAVVEIMYYRLLEIGQNVVRAKETFDAVSIAQHLSKDDVLFILSVSGESNEAKAVLECAKEQGATIVSITGSQNNTVQRLSTIALKGAEFNMRAHRFSLVNRCSQLFLLDCIFMKLWKNDDERYIRQMLEATEKLIEAGIDVSRKDSGYRL